MYIWFSCAACKLQLSDDNHTPHLHCTCGNRNPLLVFGLRSMKLIWKWSRRKGELKTNHLSITLSYENSCKELFKMRDGSQIYYHCSSKVIILSLTVHEFTFGESLLQRTFVTTTQITSFHPLWGTGGVKCPRATQLSSARAIWYFYLARTTQTPDHLMSRTPRWIKAA